MIRSPHIHGREKNCKVADEHSHSCMQNCWKLKIHITPENYGAHALLWCSDWNWHNLSNKIVNFKGNFPSTSTFASPRVNGRFPQNLAEYLFDGSNSYQRLERRNFISDAWFPLHAQDAFLRGWKSFLRIFRTHLNQTLSVSSAKRKEISRPIEISFYGRLISFFSSFGEAFLKWHFARIELSFRFRCGRYEWTFLN